MLRDRICTLKASEKCLIFGRISSISLQQIECDKTIVWAFELAHGYKYGGGLHCQAHRLILNILTKIAHWAIKDSLMPSLLFGTVDILRKSILTKIVNFFESILPTSIQQNAQ